MPNLIFNQFDGDSYSSYYGDINPLINKELNFNQNKLTNIQTPEAEYDAANKIYCDSIKTELKFQKFTIGRVIFDHALNEKLYINYDCQDIPLKSLKNSQCLEISSSNIVFESIPSGILPGLYYGPSNESSSTRLVKLDFKPSDPTPSCSTRQIFWQKTEYLKNYYTTEWGYTKNFGDLLIEVNSYPQSVSEQYVFHFSKNCYVSGQIEMNLISLWRD